MTREGQGCDDTEDMMGMHVLNSRVWVFFVASERLPPEETFRQVLLCLPHAACKKKDGANLAALMVREEEQNIKPVPARPATGGYLMSPADLLQVNYHPRADIRPGAPPEWKGRPGVQEDGMFRPGKETTGTDTTVGNPGGVLAVDPAGNAGFASFDVVVTFQWSGVLPPVRPDGASVFKAGRTVPVKFQLAGASAGITDLRARLFVSRVTDAVLGSVEEEASSTCAATVSCRRAETTQRPPTW